MTYNKEFFQFLKDNNAVFEYDCYNNGTSGRSRSIRDSVIVTQVFINKFYTGTMDSARYEGFDYYHTIASVRIKNDDGVFSSSLWKLINE